MDASTNKMYNVHDHIYYVIRYYDGIEPYIEKFHVNHILKMGDKIIYIGQGESDMSPSISGSNDTFETLENAQLYLEENKQKIIDYYKELHKKSFLEEVKENFFNKSHYEVNDAIKNEMKNIEL